MSFTLIMGDQMDEIRRKELLTLLNGPMLNLGITDDSSLLIYDHALTHRSYAKELQDKGFDCKDNERLEFLGNFILGFVIAEYLFKNFNYSEGGMTKRMEVVSDVKIAEIIRKKHVELNNKYIRLGKRNSMDNGRLEDSIIAGTFEAFIAAAYLDQGLEKTKHMILNIMGEDTKNFDPRRNYVGRLQELVHKNKLGDLKYLETRLHGPEHKPTFQMEVEVSGTKYGVGIGQNKRAAKMAAAKTAIKTLKKIKKGIPKK